MSIFQKEIFYKIVTGIFVAVFLLIIIFVALSMRNLANSSLNLDTKTLKAVTPQFDLTDFEKIRPRVQ